MTTKKEQLAIEYAGEIIKRKFKLKVKILKVLFGKEMHISDLSKKTGISYKETYRQTSDLEKWGLLERNKKLGEKHQPVMLKLTEKGNIVYEIIKK